MTEVGDRYARIADGFADRLAGVQPDQWSAPTPCTDWAVRDMVAHVINSHRRVIGRLSGDAGPAEADPDGDLTAQWVAARGAVEAALADPARAAQVVGGMAGEQSFESLVGALLCADTLVHTWDLARATGQDTGIDASASATALGFLEALGEAIRRPGGFGPKVESPAGADVQTRLLNFVGRDV